MKTNSRVVAISPSRRIITLDDGSRLGYEHLISTMPLPVLVEELGEEAPPAIRAAAESLRYVSVRCVHRGGP
jgi:UDP-galactopyranose mutase